MNMGLDAVVYRNKRIFTLEAEFAAARVDETTGEVYFEDSSQQGGYPTDTFIAAKKRLGNVTTIDHLRDGIRQAVGDRGAPTIQCKVLYSGTHGGDVIPVSDLEGLQQDVALIKDR